MKFNSKFELSINGSYPLRKVNINNTLQFSVVSSYRGLEGNIGCCLALNLRAVNQAPTTETYYVPTHPT